MPFRDEITPSGSAHHLVAQVVRRFRLLESPEFQDLEDLLEVERLPHIHHPNRAVNAVTPRTSAWSAPGPWSSRAWYHPSAESAWCGRSRSVKPELLVDLDDRQALADLGDALVQQLADDRPCRLPRPRSRRTRHRSARPVQRRCGGSLPCSTHASPARVRRISGSCASQRWNVCLTSSRQASEGPTSRCGRRVLPSAPGAPPGSWSVPARHRPARWASG